MNADACVSAGTKPDCVVCPTSPDRALSANCVRFRMKGPAFNVPVYVWATYSNQLCSFQIADDLISAPSVRFPFPLTAVIDAPCVFAVWIMHVSLLPHI